MSDNFDDIEGWVKGMLESLSPQNRAKALRKIGAHLRKSTQARITRQVGPDGSKWAARRSGKRAKMMKGLRLGRNLKVRSSSQHVSLGWSGRTGGIARVHHYGLRDRVSKKGVRVKYESRELLGLSGDDVDAISEIIEGLVTE